MDDSVIRLAKLFKDRDPVKRDTFLIGRVVSTSPLTIQADGFMLDKDEITNTVKDIQQGSSVALIPSLDFQSFLVVGEVF